MGKILKRLGSLLIILNVLICTFSTNVLSYAESNDTIKEGYYTLKNLYSNKNLNIYAGKSSNGTNINVYEEDGTQSQIFKIDKVNSSYILTPNSSIEKVVNVKGDYVKQNSNVMLYAKVGEGHSTQRWLFEEVSEGYVIKSANNSKYVLTCTGNSNSSNVNVQLYKEGNENQIWKLSECNIATSEKETAATNEGKSASQIKTQISTTYRKSRQMTGRSHFKHQCSLYVYTQLKALGIYQTPDTYWNGNRWYWNLKDNGITRTAYTQKKYFGKSCLNQIVSLNNNKNVYNVLVSFPHSYVSGKNYGSGGPGHVLFIHAIIDGKVYYSDNYVYCGMPEGSVIVKTISEFTNYFSYHYGGITGAVHFKK